MAHRFPLKEIALQSGLSLATVDRVVNARGQTSPQAARRVADALDELANQERQIAAKGRRVFVDVVVEAPQRFSQEVRQAALRCASDMGGVNFRPRFHFAEISEPNLTLQTLARIQKTGTQGLVLKARNVSAIRDQVDHFAGRGVPVVTLVTDIPQSQRSAYVGPDNFAAGATAAHLIAQALQSGCVLAASSQPDFEGEQMRLSGFMDTLSDLAPHVQVTDLTGSAGLSMGIAEALQRNLDPHTKIQGIYSMGGGNAALLDGLARLGHRPRLFVGHDLDAENRKLLRRKAIDFIIHHDLYYDLWSAFQAISTGLGIYPPRQVTERRAPAVLTPYNLPQ